MLDGYFTYSTCSLISSNLPSSCANSVSTCPAPHQHALFLQPSCKPNLGVRSYKIRLTKPQSSPGLTTSFTTAFLPPAVGFEGDVLGFVDSRFVWLKEVGSKAAVWGTVEGPAVRKALAMLARDSLEVMMLNEIDNCHVNVSNEEAENRLSNVDLVCFRLLFRSFIPL